MSRSFIVCLLTLALVGCPDSETDDDTHDIPMDDDTSLFDDDNPSDDDIGDGPCFEASWPDIEVEIRDECGAVLADEPELLLAWDHSYEQGCPTIRAGYFVDVDADGTTGPPDPMQMWLSVDQGGTHEVLVGHDGSWYATVLWDTWGSWGTVGEIVPEMPGMEYVSSFYFHGGSADYVSLFNGSETIWTTPLPDDAMSRPWLTDLEGDGELEVLVGSHILDAVSGVQIGSLEDLPADFISHPVAADLDLDGTREIVTADNWTPGVSIFAADGSLIESCWSEIGDWSHAYFAIGNMDGDAEGEVVAVGVDFIVVCDSDGTLITASSPELVQPALVGLGELDGDPLPEIIVDDSSALYVFDTDLTLLWTFDVDSTDDWDWYPFALADLTGDGFHEIVVRVGAELFVLDRLGRLLTTVVADDYFCGSWVGAPAVVDIDADGLAEIVVPAWPSFAVLENSSGGWQVEDSDHPWPDFDKYPGDRTVEGGIPSPLDVHWDDPRTNVWQGTQTSMLPPVALADFGVTAIDVCTEQGADSSLVTAYVANHGQVWTTTDVGVRLVSLADGTQLGDAVMAPTLLPGMARAVQWTAPVEALTAGVVVSVDTSNAVEECDEINNDGEWTP